MGEFGTLPGLRRQYAQQGSKPIKINQRRASFLTQIHTLIGDLGRLDVTGRHG